MTPRDLKKERALALPPTIILAMSRSNQLSNSGDLKAQQESFRNLPYTTNVGAKVPVESSTVNTQKNSIGPRRPLGMHLTAVKACL